MEAHIIIWKLGNVDFMIRADGTMEWEEQSRPAPTQAEYDVWVTEYNAEIASTKYQRDRAQAYASLQEQADMKYHDDVNGTSTWFDHIAAVKARFPKPE